MNSIEILEQDLNLPEYEGFMVDNDLGYHEIFAIKQPKVEG